MQEDENWQPTWPKLAINCFGALGLRDKRAKCVATAAVRNFAISNGSRQRCNRGRLHMLCTKSASLKYAVGALSGSNSREAVMRLHSGQDCDGS
eukprot:3549139-Pleurochrysis_carterae.AAC.1